VPRRSSSRRSYPISASSNGNAYKSRVYVAPLNGTPHVLLNDTDDSHGWALPFAWTAQSIWVARPGFGLGGAADRAQGQDEFARVAAVESACGRDAALGIAGGLGIGVGVKRGVESQRLNSRRP